MPSGHIALLNLWCNSVVATLFATLLLFLSSGVESNDIIYYPESCGFPNISSRASANTKGGQTFNSPSLWKFYDEFLRRKVLVLLMQEWKQRLGWIKTHPAAHPWIIMNLFCLRISFYVFFYIKFLMRYDVHSILFLRCEYLQRFLRPSFPLSFLAW